MRELSAFLVGYLLTLSGSLIQGVTQNPLGSPSTLGMNAFCVLIVLICHFVLLALGDFIGLEIFSLMVFLFLWSLGFFLWWRRTGENESNRAASQISHWILFGLCFNLFVGALFSIVQFAFVSLNMSFPTQIWYGNFRFVQLGGLIVLGLWFLFLQFWVMKKAKDFYFLSLGADFAEGLGLNVTKLQKEAIAVSFLCVGLSLSQFGMFAFLGLVFPLLLRQIGRYSTNFKSEIQEGPWLGGLALMFLDILCARWLIKGAEVPVGMVSSLLGTLGLVVVLIKTNASETIK